MEMANSSISNYCLNEEQMRLSASDFEGLIIGKIVPLIITFGISGNMINLTVLLDGSMRTRSNQLLACLAVTDIVFLLFMLPHSMAHYRVFAHSYYFRLFYLTYKMHLIAILNWTSACAIWLILVICMERLIAIRWPLSTREGAIISPSRIVFLVVVATGILTFYNHFSYFCAIKFFCSGSQPHAICLHQDAHQWFPNQSNPNPDWLRLVVRWNPILNAIILVFVPILLVVFSNILLICTIKKRQNMFVAGEVSSHNRVEQRVTLTVTAIVTSFTITQGPSAVLNVLGVLTQHLSIVAFTLATCLVVIGKALNFVLFCTSSASFRQRLLHKTKLMRKETRRKLTFLTGETDIPLVSSEKKLPREPQTQTTL